MLCAGSLLCAAWRAGFAAGPGVNVAQARPQSQLQPIRIPLEPMGFQTLPADYLLTGAVGMTVDFVDNDHLLVTFNTRHLMKREPDEQPGDDDRTVEAALVELPSGKVLAQTEWRLHDRLEYLWNLGHGRFLLRVRDRLTMLMPMERLGDGDAFRGTPVLDLSSNGVDRHIVALMLSSDEDLLTLETVGRSGGGVDGGVLFSGSNEDAGVQINFYRLNDTPEGFMAELAGIVRVHEAMELPMTRAGTLDILSGGKNRWLFNFNEHGGKVDELAEWDTACQPQATFVSHSEFVAFACHGNEDNPAIAGFNMKGEQMWEQGLYEPYVAPDFAFAPAAGRFVLERTILTTSMGGELTLSSGAVAGEEARVYQAETGKVLLTVNVSPAERAGGNFALSPDGMELATFEQTISQRRTSRLGDAYAETATTLVVYPLPALSEQERAQVKEMEAKAPADTGARIDAALVRMGQEGVDGATDRTATPVAQVAAESSVLPSAGTNGASPVDASAGAAANQEPGNPAMTGELPNAPGAGGQSAAEKDAEDGTTGPSRAPTLYEPGEGPQTPGSKKEQ